ncbi:MAG: DUF1570 domain-containing protein [Pirellulaceae bacterium]
MSKLADQWFEWNAPSSHLRELGWIAPVLLFLAIAGLTPASIIAQPESDGLSDRVVYHEQLDSLAQWCDEQGLQSEADATRARIMQRDPARQYIYMPPVVAPVAPADASDLQQELHNRLMMIERDFAEKLLQQAQLAAEQDRGAAAYQRLHEVLAHDPDHAEARRILGFRQAEDGNWMRSARGTRANESRTRQETMGWAAGTYHVIQSPHFMIYSAAGAEAGLDLAEHLEQAYWVWRQVYFSYWCNTDKLKAWLSGQNSDSSSSRRYDVILFRDREHYLSDLADVAGIEISSGYYNEDRKASFFYAAADPPLDTWRHEIVHQLLQENSGSRATISERGHAWLVEGIAMYFESLRVHDGYVTLGGIDTVRLQTARLRAKREGFYVPLEELDAMDREELQRSPDVRKLYSQSAGLSQFLLTTEDGKYREGFIDYIKQFYRKRRLRISLADLTAPFDQLDRQYAAFLDVDRESWLQQAADCGQPGLAMGRSGLRDEDLANLVGWNGINWLELSENPIGDEGMGYLARLPQLSQLFLDVTAVTDAAGPTLARMTTLEELDLASTRFGDEGLQQLVDLPNLQVLWLAGSRVTDASIDNLLAMPGLQLLDLRQTEVTDAGVTRLKNAKPDLRVLK